MLPLDRLHVFVVEKLVCEGTLVVCPGSLCVRLCAGEPNWGHQVYCFSSTLH